MGRKMQRDRLSIPRTPSPSGISGVPCVLTHGGHGNAGRSIRAVGTGQDERDCGLGLCLGLGLSRSGPLSFLTPTAARTRRDAEEGRWGIFACRACWGVPVRGTYLYP